MRGSGQHIVGATLAARTVPMCLVIWPDWSFCLVPASTTFQATLMRAVDVAAVKALFVDSMVFLHYKPIRDIAWLEVAKAERVRLIVARVTISELE